MTGFDPKRFSKRIQAFRHAAGVEEIRAAVMDAVGEYGIECAYFLAPLTSDPRIGRIITNVRLPQVWERHYRARLHKCDPLPDIAQSMDGAFYWPDDIAQMPLAENQLRYMKVAARYGMARGIGVACYGPHGRAGFFGCIWPEEMRPSGDVLIGVYLISQASFQRYCSILPQGLAVPKLSNRELEVLSWMCEGKSNPVIAQLLGISRSSVDVYVRRLFSKLNVADRTAACVRAYSIGLTVPGEYQRFIGRIKDEPEFGPGS